MQGQLGAGKGTTLPAVDELKLAPPNIKLANMSGDEAQVYWKLCESTPGYISLIMERRTASSHTIRVAP